MIPAQDFLRFLESPEGSSLLAEFDKRPLRRGQLVSSPGQSDKAVFSWSELYNTSVGEGVLALYAREGKPLGDDEGRIALISTKDSHTSPRHVRWLKDVQVQKIV
jgi:hypothetical protein